MLKNRKIVYLIIALTFFIFKDMKAAEVTTNECPIEEIYIHTQKAIQINSGCKLSSSLNFKVPDNNLPKIITKSSISHNYKTSIHIPKAKID